MLCSCTGQHAILEVAILATVYKLPQIDLPSLDNEFLESLGVVLLWSLGLAELCLSSPTVLVKGRWRGRGEETS